MLTSYMETRFGIPRASFDDYLFFEKSKSWWLLIRSAHLQKSASLKISSYGMKAFQKVGQFVKPTTRMIQVFADRATRSVVNISENDLFRLLAGQGVEVAEPIQDGYVILSLGGHALGLGLCIRGWVRSQIRVKEFRHCWSPEQSASPR